MTLSELNHLIETLPESLRSLARSADAETILRELRLLRDPVYRVAAERRDADRRKRGAQLLEAAVAAGDIDAIAAEKARKILGFG